MPLSSPDSHGELFGLVLTTDAMAAATSDRAWLVAMLAFEEELAAVQAEAGMVPTSAASEIARACRQLQDVDAGALGRAGRLTGTPAVALVSELRRSGGPDAERWAHFGATSQDVVDTAMMLVLRDALDLLLSDLEGAARAAAELAARFRSVPMLARTLLQPALPTTFGRKCAGWLVMLCDARQGVAHIRRNRLAVQLGGPAGTAADWGAGGAQLTRRLAGRLGLAAPAVPWHTDRSRVIEAAGALAIAAGTAGKIARDVSLLMQAEVGEVAEPAAEGRGESSSMPHKRNPALAVAALAAWQRVPGCHSSLLAGMAQEHERAAGAWQAEPAAVSDLCLAAGGAVAAVAELLGGLEVYPERMAANLRQAGQDVIAPETAAWMVDRVLELMKDAPDA